MRRDLAVHIGHGTIVWGTCDCPENYESYACFAVPEGKNEPPMVMISDCMRGAKGSWWEVLGHELAHYERWRDRRPNGERGITVRGRTIAKAIRRELRCRR